MAEYTGITIGPIYKTLSLARKTRELWGASYLFSYIMRRIIELIGDTSKCCLPFHTNLITDGKGKGAGLFPDRLIYEGNIKDKINDIETTIIEEIAASSELTKSYLENYIRIYALTFTLPVSISGNHAEDNIVLVANKLLDTIELQEKYYSQDISGIDWKKAIDNLNKNTFYGEAFIGKDKNFQFPSIIEIATDDFRRKDKIKYYSLVKKFINKETEDEQTKFLTALKETGFEPVKVRPYHKYIAVVQADGDNIGETIKKIGNNSNTVKNFSSALFAFAIEVAKIIKYYGGKSVYIGGDDLLFFAPVAVFNEGNNQAQGNLQSIFKLINDIDICFNKKIIDNPVLKSLYEPRGVLENNKPSMSYGISITYSKFPLNEARDNAYFLLKKAKEIKNDKNKICFKVNKHSGQGFGFIIDKKKSNATTPKSFDLFLKMVSKIPLQDKLLSSIIYKIAPLHTLLTSIANDKTRLDLFFEQEFELGKKEISRMTKEEIANENFMAKF